MTGRRDAVHVLDVNGDILAEDPFRDRAVRGVVGHEAAGNACDSCNDRNAGRPRAKSSLKRSFTGWDGPAKFPANLLIK